MPEDNRNYPRDFRVVKDEHEEVKKFETEEGKEVEYREETAAEYAPNQGIFRENRTVDVDVDEEREETTAGEGRGLATFAVALSIVSLLFLPILFGAAGLILGFMAVNREQRGLGYTAIAISAFSIIMSVFFAPFVT
ncbi:hypothetical protein J2S74_001765 [Evansella vedderi]|uniref:DUF4190 domain-containing protein n=1 Tax=Evansella vedderi TaxID=38282 RepID=A0ABT9ZTX1_9BACI|nr:DUF4190 domain-containing protein [Evansella vedderi]MDQ0254390.1 hypothetical protein [Evansella vedderi]